MSKDFRRDGFNGNQEVKFRYDKKSFPPPSIKETDNSKKYIFFMWILLTAFTAGLYTLAAGALFSILDSNELIAARPGTKDTFLFILIVQLMRQWDRALKGGSSKP